MDDRMLTRLLESSSPSTTESADRDAALNALLDARLPRSRRARSVTAAVAVTGALVLGGTTTAVAVPAVITHLGWLAEASTTQVTADGTTCAHGFRISAMPERPTEAAALDVARTALVSVDLETLDGASECDGPLTTPVEP